MGPSRIVRLRIWGFRGIAQADLRFAEKVVLVGQNGCGKSTIIDALALVLGRTKMVRQLTEHDFRGSDPQAATRIRVVATLGGFSSTDPDDHDEWFREDRGVPKWLATDGTEHSTSAPDRTLVVNVGFAARFDHDELEVETLRYFHDDDGLVDPFDDAAAPKSIHYRVLNELGFFVLPARRSWDAVASFNSDLFRRIVLNAAGIPAAEVLEQRNHLRNPATKIEESPRLASLVTGLNTQLSRLVLGAPKFQLRVTAGDAEAVLQALLPHYEAAPGPGLPAARHGTGLVSLQSLLLLLEVGKARKAKGLPFVIALEEPELHLAPGLHARVVSDAIATADQVLCTTHSPDVARAFDATSTYLVTNQAGAVRSTALLATPLSSTASNNERKIYLQNRARVVQALMHPFVLVPEGRFDVEWLARLALIAEPRMNALPPFGTVFGIVPTENAAVTFTVEKLAPLRRGIVALVDGDAAGDGYVAALKALGHPPETIVQWPPNWTIEDVVKWCLEVDAALLPRLQAVVPQGFTFASFDQLRDLLRQNNDRANNIVGLKEDVLTHEAILGVLETSQGPVDRVVLLCNALVSAATNNPTAQMLVHPATTPATRVFRFQP